MNVCKDCEFFLSWQTICIDGIGGEMRKECLHSSCFVKEIDPVDGPTKRRIASCEEKNREGKCSDYKFDIRLLSRKERRRLKKEMRV